MATVFINEDRLTAIGDAIRAKTGESALLKVADMPSAIEGITTGGGSGDGYVIPEEAKRISGDCNSGFGSSSTLPIQQDVMCDWFLKQDGLYTEDITGAAYMFGYCDMIEEIPFDINFSPSSSNIAMTAMFRNCNKLKKIGTIRNFKPRNGQYLFESCHNLRELPKFENIDCSYLHSVTYNCGYTFSSCFSLREIPSEFLNQWWNNSTSAMNNAYYKEFNSCVALNMIIGIMPAFEETQEVGNNLFANTFNDCSRVKDIVFATKEDDSVYNRMYGNQIIDLSYGVGYARYSQYRDYILNYNSGITANKEVKDAETYAALKNDDDWFTCDIAYSRYNHDSAVNTINSLPDTTTGAGSNTIKFLGESGSATDGGAINTLTEAEIAVAAAKGWTVTLV